MSSGLDLSQFYETFFDEAEELLSDMERLLLELDLDDPSADDLNAIFRAAHSIKGGAGTFGCFGYLADTTHLLENVLDAIRKGEMPLRKDMIDLFLETKDVLMDQVATYRNLGEPDADAYERICAQLKELAREHRGDAPAPAPAPAVAQGGAASAVTTVAPASAAPHDAALCVKLSRLSASDIDSLAAEMALMGEIVHQEKTADSLTVWLNTTTAPADIEAVCCFVVNSDQVVIERSAVPGASPVVAPATEPTGQRSAEPEQDQVQTPDSPQAAEPVNAPAAAKPAAAAGKAAKPAAEGKAGGGSSSTIRVGVEKVDQIINLVGELVITQAMLVQTASTLDPVLHDRLLNGIEQLERNARDLQEAVMSIRMVPMDYVFSRFPRVVRESAAKMGKQIKLTTKGQATELDKSLIERIIDPLTHLVRNSIDHGVESPEKRVAVGKEPEGNMVLSAQHHGGQIVIEVSDDGAGLNREKILAKAMKQGLPVSENTPDEELWQLIFAPGFSTAEKVTDISGRGVGMDVVRRNIQGMGGHIQLSSAAGKGTSTRIVLPLTLAILDGMSVKVGEETFILPLSHVTESMQPSTEQIHRISETECVLHVRGEYLPMVALHDVFSVSGAETDPMRAIAVILQAEDVRFALLVDHLIGQHQVVVKNLESNYRKIPGVSAATILGDGSVALIVDVFALMRVTRNKEVAL